MIVLRLPFDVIDEYISTPIKALIARRLWREGYTQIQIARILGVSQPTVNIYIRSPTYKEEKILERLLIAGIDRVQAEALIDRVLSLLKEDRKMDAMAILTEYIVKSLSELRLCDAHRRLDPSIPLDCRICSNLIQVPIDMSILRALESAYEYLSKNRCIYILVPEVMMNIAYSKEAPSSINDIAAFPGRITKIGKGIASLSKPSWGASRHLGRILLKIASKRRDARAIANIKTLDCVKKALDEMGISYKTLGPRSTYEGEEEIISEIGGALIEEGVVAVVDLGGMGLEPVTYIVGRDPLEISVRISRIARICAEAMGIEC